MSEGVNKEEMGEVDLRKTEVKKIDGDKSFWKKSLYLLTEVSENGFISRQC